MRIKKEVTLEYRKYIVNETTPSQKYVMGEFTIVENGKIIMTDETITTRILQAFFNRVEN